MSSYPQQNNPVIPTNPQVGKLPEGVDFADDSEQTPFYKFQQAFTSQFGRPLDVTGDTSNNPMHRTPAKRDAFDVRIHDLQPDHLSWMDQNLPRYGLKAIKSSGSESWSTGPHWHLEPVPGFESQSQSQSQTMGSLPEGVEFADEPTGGSSRISGLLSDLKAANPQGVGAPNNLPEEPIKLKSVPGETPLSEPSGLIPSPLIQQQPTPIGRPLNEQEQAGPDAFKSKVFNADVGDLVESTPEGVKLKTGVTSEQFLKELYQNAASSVGFTPDAASAYLDQYKEQPIGRFFQGVDPRNPSLGVERILKQIAPAPQGVRPFFQFVLNPHDQAAVRSMLAPEQAEQQANLERDIAAERAGWQDKAARKALEVQRLVTGLNPEGVLPESVTKNISQAQEELLKGASLGYLDPTLAGRGEGEQYTTPGAEVGRVVGGIAPLAIGGALGGPAGLALTAAAQPMIERHPGEKYDPEARLKSALINELSLIPMEATGGLAGIAGDSGIKAAIARALAGGVGFAAAQPLLQGRLPETGDWKQFAASALISLAHSIASSKGRQEIKPEDLNEARARLALPPAPREVELAMQAGPFEAPAEGAAKAKYPASRYQRPEALKVQPGAQPEAATPPETKPARMVYHRDTGLPLLVVGEEGNGWIVKNPRTGNTYPIAKALTQEPISRMYLRGTGEPLDVSQILPDGTIEAYHEKGGLEQFNPQWLEKEKPEWRREISVPYSTKENAEAAAKRYEAVNPNTATEVRPATKGQGYQWFWKEGKAVEKAPENLPEELKLLPAGRPAPGLETEAQSELNRNLESLTPAQVSPELEAERKAELQKILYGKEPQATTGAPPSPVSSPQEMVQEPAGRAVENVKGPIGDAELQESANRYNRQNGRADIQDRPYTTVDPRAKQIADAYDEMPHAPNDPAVRHSYDALKREIKAQWDHAVAEGVRFEPWEKEGQPYNNSSEMMADIKNKKHLWFFQGGDMPSDHPLSEVDPQAGLSYNDMLRAVHDLYGHAVNGYSFGPRGEENAWLKHTQMFSDDALPALTTETKGQNSWVNYGAHLRDENGNAPKVGERGYVPPSERPFAEQKAGLLPAEFWKREEVQNEEGSSIRGRTREATATTQPIEAGREGGPAIPAGPQEAGGKTGQAEEKLRPGILPEEAGAILRRKYGQESTNTVYDRRTGNPLKVLGQEGEAYKVQNEQTGKTYNIHRNAVMGINHNDLPEIHREMKDVGLDARGQLEAFQAMGIRDFDSPAQMVGGIRMLDAAKDEGGQPYAEMMYGAKRGTNHKIVGRFPGGEKLMVVDPNGVTHVHYKSPYSRTGNALIKQAPSRFDLGQVPEVSWEDIGLLSDPFPSLEDFQRINPNADKNGGGLTDAELQKHFPQVYKNIHDAEGYIGEKAAREAVNQGMESNLPEEPQKITDTPEFKKWFGDSKVVDDQGLPLRVFHGTAKDFDTYDLENAVDYFTLGKGLYFTSDPESAAAFGEQHQREGAVSINPVYLRMEKPFILDQARENNTTTQDPTVQIRRNGYPDMDAVKMAGYDGVVVRNGIIQGTEYVVFKPDQINSSISPANPTPDEPNFVQNSRNRLRNHLSGGTLSANPIHTLYDTAVITGWDVYKAGKYTTDNLKEWTKDMVERLGERTRPYLEDVWRKLHGEAPQWYSPLENSIKLRMPNKASADQIKGILRSGGFIVKGEGGIERPNDEAHWTGLYDFLQRKSSAKEPVTKQEILDHLAKNRVELQERQFSEIPDLDKLDSDYSSVNNKLRNAFRATGMSPNEANQITYKASKEGVDAVASYGEDIKNLAQQLYDITQKLANPAKFTIHTTPGGTNHKELTLSLPGPDNTAAGRTYNKNYLVPSGHRYGVPEADTNRIALIRVNDRVGPNGEKILHLDEYQDDLQNQIQGAKASLKEKQGKYRERTGQEDNFKDDEEEIQRLESLLPFRGKSHELALKRVLDYGIRNGYDAISWATGQMVADRYDLSKYYDEVGYDKNKDGTYDLSGIAKGENNRRSIADNVPAGKLEEYGGKELARKIISGEGEKDFSNKFEVVNENGRWYARQSRGQIGDRPFDVEYSSQREAQNRVDELRSIHGTDLRVLKGVDLQIGGEGKKVLYDNLIPNFLSKYTKRWGGKVGEAEIGTGGSGLVDVYDASGERVLREQEPQNAERWIDSNEGDQFEGLHTKPSFSSDTANVHSLSITPDMKEAILKTGQPLFGSSEGEPPMVIDARARLAESMSGKRMNMNPVEDLKDLALITGYDVYKMARKFGGWSNQMVKRLGEQVRPHLESTYAKIKLLAAISAPNQEGAISLGGIKVKGIPDEAYTAADEFFNRGGGDYKTFQSYMKVNLSDKYNPILEKNLFRVFQRARANADKATSSGRIPTDRGGTVEAAKNAWDAVTRDFIGEQNPPPAQPPDMTEETESMGDPYGRQEQQEKGRTPVLTFLDGYTKNNLLMSLSPLTHKQGSLFMSSLTDIAIQPFKAGVDFVLSKIFNTPREVVFDPQGMGRAIKSTLSVKEASDMRDILRRGYTQEEAEKFLIPNEITGWGPLGVLVNYGRRIWHAGVHPYQTFAFTETKNNLARIAAEAEVKNGDIGKSQINTRAQEIARGENVSPGAVETMNMYGDIAAAEATFNNETVVTQLWSRFKQLPQITAEHAIRKGDLTLANKLAKMQESWEFSMNRGMPFFRIPFNAVTRTVEMTPGVGQVLTALRLATSKLSTGQFFPDRQSRLRFDRSIATLPVGAGLYALGMIANQHNLMTGLAWQPGLKGQPARQPGSLNISRLTRLMAGSDDKDKNLDDDKWIDVARYTPAGLVLAQGATFNDLRNKSQSKREAGEEAPSFMSDYLSALTHVAAHVPLVTGMAGMGKAMESISKGDWHGAVGSGGSSILKSFIPGYATLRDVTGAYDKTIREHVPGASMVLGEPKGEPKDVGYLNKALHIQKGMAEPVSSGLVEKVRKQYGEPLPERKKEQIKVEDDIAKAIQSKNHKEADRLYTEGIKNGTLPPGRTDKDGEDQPDTATINRIKDKATLTPLQYLIKHNQSIDLEAALDAYLDKRATDAERQEIAPVVMQKEESYQKAKDEGRIPGLKMKTVEEKVKRANEMGIWKMAMPKASGQ